MEFSFPAEMWLHDGDAPWHFVTLPVEVADQIDAAGGDLRRGFGSIEVSVAIGATSWSTSIFPDAKAGSFVLPIKRTVREREQIVAGDTVTVSLSVVEGRTR